MIYNCLRITFLLVLFSMLAKVSNAQSNYYKWSVGFGAGVNHSKSDVVEGSWGHTYYGVIDYNLTPFVTAGLEGQYGIVQGGDIVTDRNNRQFVNKYTAVSLNLKFGLGEFVDYNNSNFLYNIRGLYAGVGAGIIKNNIIDVVRYRPSWSNDPGYGPFPGKDKSSNILVPLNLGINFYIKDNWGYARYVINLNAQSNFTFGEGLDGYDDPDSKFKNYDPDTYNVYSVGFKYYFGNMRTSRKTL